MRARRRFLPVSWPVGIVIASLVLAGVAFRFTHLDRKVYWSDEVYTSLRVAGYTRAQVKAQTDALDGGEWLRYQRVSSDRTFFDVIRAIRDDVHPPLYFLLAYEWGRGVGSTPWALRCLSAVIGVLALPAMFWLGWEVFGRVGVAWAATVLLAVSPFHVLYAQEARPYSLWTLTTLLSSAALLRALRRGGGAAWALYAGTVAVSLYTHYLAVVVVVSHAVYVLATMWPRPTRRGLAFVLAATVAGASFAPWMLLAHRVGGAGYTRRSIPVLTWACRWLMNIGGIFLDPQVGRPGPLVEVGRGQDLRPGLHEVSTYLFVLLVVLAVYSFRALRREESRSAWWFVVTLVGGPVSFLAVPDILTGGQRSTMGRYLIPAFLGVELAVAYCLAARIGPATGPATRRWAWRLTIASVLSAGVVSCAISSQADTWWTKYGSYYDHEVARHINRAPSPLVLVGGPIQLLGLAHLVRPDVRLQLAERAMTVPGGTPGDVFVFDPARRFLAGLGEGGRQRMQPVHEQGKLWRYTPGP